MFFFQIFLSEKVKKPYLACLVFFCVWTQTPVRVTWQHRPICLSSSVCPLLSCSPSGANPKYYFWIMMCANAFPTYIKVGKPNKIAHAAGIRGGFLGTQKKRSKDLACFKPQRVCKKTNSYDRKCSLLAWGYPRLRLFHSKWARVKHAGL